ncbi:MAG: hypothetical protein HOL08_03595 [Opitutae bacterium]|nr:hypothetical protein [Opitutae bacterium]
MFSHIPTNKKPIIHLVATMLLSSISLPVFTYGQADNLPATSAEARQEIEEKLATQPDDPLANYLYGFWQLAELAESDEFQAMMVSIGIPSSFHGLTVFDGEIPSSKDAEINKQFQPSELRAYVVDNLLPVLDALGTRFASLGKDQTIQLSDEYYDLENDIIIDYADSLVLQALVKAYTFLVRIQLAYNWELSVSSLIELDNNGLGSVESIRDIASNIGAVYDATLLVQAGENLKDAINYYQKASPLLRNTKRKVGLFVLEANDFEEEVEFSDQLYKVENTLDGTQAWGVSDPVTVNLQPFFEGNVDFSLLLPDSVGNQFVDATLTDPTFGSILPDMTDSELRNHARSADLLTENIWISSIPLQSIGWWDWHLTTAIAGHWWQSHWLGIYFRQAPNSWHEYENRIFPNEWLYHIWMGWAYPVTGTPKSVWLWQQDPGQWIWTNSSFFPVFFNFSHGGWFYISETDGSYYIWDGTKWTEWQE